MTIPEKAGARAGEARYRSPSAPPVAGQGRLTKGYPRSNREADDLRPLETSNVKIERVNPADKLGRQIPSRQIGLGTDTMPRSSVVRADPMTTAKFQANAFAVGARRSALVD